MTPILLTAQPDGGPPLDAIRTFDPAPLIYACLALGAVLLGVLGLLVVLRRGGVEPPEAAPAFTLSQLRELVERGELSAEEYESMKARIIARFKKSDDFKAIPPAKPPAALKRPAARDAAPPKPETPEPLFDPPVGTAPVNPVEPSLPPPEPRSSDRPPASAEAPPAPQAETPPAPQAETPPAPQAETPSAPQAETPSAPQAETQPGPQAETPAPADAFPSAEPAPVAAAAPMAEAPPEPQPAAEAPPEPQPAAQS
jgi:hypothetical protein